MVFCIFSFLGPHIPLSFTVAQPLTALPFRSNTFDALLTDIPFGIAHGSTSYNRTLYPQLLTEFYRIARERVVCVCVTSRSQERLIHKTLAVQGV